MSRSQSNNKPRSIKQIAMRDRGMSEAEAERVSQVIHARRQRRLGERIRAQRGES